MATIALRAPCKKCGCEVGQMTTKNGQDVVRCQECNAHQYCAPKTETGRKQRSVSTVHARIKPKQRSRIIDRANGRCERCGKPQSETRAGIHVGHVIGVKQGMQSGLSDAEINSDENLIAECDECNLGHGKDPVPLRVYIAILRARLEGQQ